MNVDFELSQKREMQLREMFSFILKLSVSDISLELGAANCSEWDSIAHIEIIILLEKLTGQEISPEKVSKLMSYAEIVSFLGEIGFLVER